MQKDRHSSVLYVGGFSSSRSLVKKVGKYLKRSLDSDTKTVTFSWAVKHPDKLALLAHEAHVITHSAGFLALYMALLAHSDCKPKKIQAVAPPDAVKGIKELAIATAGVKTLEMYKHARKNKGTMRDFVHFMTSGGVELMSHPIIYSKIIRQVVTFESISAAQELAKGGLKIDIFLMNTDHYFDHSEVEEIQTDKLHVYRIDGLHDDVAMRSSSVIDRIVDVIGDS